MTPNDFLYLAEYTGDSPESHLVLVGEITNVSFTENEITTVFLRKSEPITLSDPEGSLFDTIRMILTKR